MIKRILWVMTASASLLMIWGCNISGVYTAYENAEQYVTGDAEIRGVVHNLDIDWKDGSVKIEYHVEDTVGISETSAKMIPDEMAVHWWLDDTTLHIKYAASNQVIAANLNKSLTVVLPVTWRMESICISTTSADIENDVLSADRVELSATSGDITARCDAENICMSATSGELDLAQTGEAGELIVTSTSGDIHVQSEKVERAKFGSTSGEVMVSCAQTPKELDIAATSGDVTLWLPGDVGLTAEISTTSGSFDTDLAMKKDGSHYICGKGESSVIITTTSGDVLISERKP